MTNTRGASLYSGRLMTWPMRSMNGAMPVVSGVAANTFPVCTSRAASRARAPWRTYSCSTRTGLPRVAAMVGRQRPRAWMEGLASTDKIRSPGRSRVPW